jgi:hypothetical protein
MKLLQYEFKAQGVHPGTVRLSELCHGCHWDARPALGLTETQKKALHIVKFPDTLGVAGKSPARALAFKIL